jgi:hypothetical protein
MAISIACPSCNQPFGLPESFTGGRATCPNPQCGKTFYAPEPGAEPTPGRVPARGRIYPVRPGVTSHIPPNLYASPAFVAGGGVFAMLYGMVLFAVLSGQRRNVEETVDDPVPSAPLVFVEPRPAPEPPAVSRPKAPAPTKADAPKAEPPKASVKPPQPPQPPQSRAPEPPASPSAAPKNTPQPAPAPAPEKPPQPKRPAAPPKAVALNTSPTPPPEPGALPTVEGPTFPGLSPWVDPGRKARARQDEGAIVLDVPDGVHMLSPELQHHDAPMSLAEVSGDFELLVRVGGGLRPGATPIPKLPVPIAFQGAGILIFQDPDNYLRFERAAMSGPDRPLIQQVLVEVYRDGRPQGKPVYKDTSDGPLTLRLTRKGPRLECAYTPDGKNWIIVKRSAIALFPDKVRVGLAASNLSPRPFSPRFENFGLGRPGEKTSAR